MLVVALLFVTLGIAEAAESKIYWIEQGSKKVRCANLDGSNVQDLITTGLDKPFGIALDVSDDKVYWTDWKTDTIKRANLNGTNIETLISGLPVPLGIALDIASGKMYWTDIEADTIKRANLNGTNIETLISGLPAPYGIALDIASGKMYWTDKTANTIKRANLNGTNIETLVSRLSDPHSIALDIANGKMYWTDTGVDTIKRANFNGTNIETLVSRLANPVGIALDIANGKMYWTDFGTGRIKRANLDGKNVGTILSGLSNPVGIALGVSDGGDVTDDHSNTRAGATFLPLGGSRIGKIAPGNDVDYFRIEVSGPGVIKVYTTGNLDTVGELQNSSGKVLAGNDGLADRNYNFGIQHKITAGTYYIRVSSYKTNTGSYTLRASFTLDPSAAGISLKLPEDLISEVAFGPNSTYFVLNAQYPILTGASGDLFYGQCILTFDLPGVPDNTLLATTWLTLLERYIQAIDEIDRTTPLFQFLDRIGISPFDLVADVAADAFLPNAREYFMFPLETMQEVRDKIQEEAIRNQNITLITAAIGMLPFAGDLGGTVVGLGVIELQRLFALIELVQSTMDPKIHLNPGIGDIVNYIIGDRSILDVFTDFFKQDGRPDDQLRYLIYIPKRVEEIGIKIEQKYRFQGRTGELEYNGKWKLAGGTLAAPSAQLTSLADYPPFQMLPPEVQAYLLQRFGELMNTGNRQIQEETALLPNYPNPFNPETWIPYQLATPADITVTIHAVDGTVVRTLVLGHKPVGTYQGKNRAAYWDGRNAQGEPVASGVYFYTLTAGDFTATRKMLIRK